MALTRTTGNSGGIFPTVADLQNAEMAVNHRAELSTGERYVINATNGGNGVLLVNGNYANPIGLEGIRYDLINNPNFDLFAKNKVGVMLNGAFTNESTTEATYTDVYGTLQTATTDGTFRQFRPEGDGYRFEGTSTNLALHSADFSDASWVKVSCTISQDGTLSPDGVTQAYLVTNNVTGVGSMQLRQSASTTLGVQKVGSFWLKGIAGQTVKVELRASDSSTVSQAPYTFTGEWERLSSVTLIDWSGQTQAIVNVAVRVDAVNTATSFYVADAQFEELPFATSYIPTTVAPVTRTADENSAPYYANMPRGDQAFTIRFKGVIDGYTNTNRLFGAESGINEVKAIVNNDLSISLFNGNDSSRADTAPIIAGAVFDYVITSDGTNYKSYLGGVFQNSSTVNNPAIGITNELRILRGAGAANDAYGNCSIFQSWIGETLTAEEIKFISGGE